MKYKILFLLSIGINTFATNVTFRIDLSQETVSTNGVHLAGSMQSWDPATTLMTDIGNNVFEITIQLIAGEYHEFKYVNGNAWGSDESVPANCGIDNGVGGYNRFVTVPIVDTILPTICFGSCNPCSMPQVLVTVKVDMSQQIISADGVHIAGNFQNWDPAADLMTDLGNDIYSISLTLDEGYFLEYKYINGNVWGSDETVPPECGLNNNRFLIVPIVDTTLEAICFGACVPCGSLIDTVDVSFQVDLSQDTISPLGIHIAGTFQNWDPAATEMIDIGAGIYSYTIPLISGESHQYKFINGDAWGMEEIVPANCAYNDNRFLTIPSSDTVLSVVCFASCYPCIIPTSLVTFQVDMSQNVVSTNGVHIAGSFQNWDPTTDAMTNIGNDIFTFSAYLVVGETFEYKFINGTDWNDAENVPSSCSQNDNRFLTVSQNDTIVPIVCFSSCFPCNISPVEISFQVQLCQQNPSPDGVHIAGSFQGWDPGITQMTDLGNGKYLYVASFYPGEYYEYKFINGTLWSEAELVPAECSQNDNRFIIVPDNDTILPAVCFETCSPLTPGWSISITENIHNIIIPNYAEIYIDGNPIENGDYVGVFYDSSGILACGGYLVWDNNATVLPAFGANQFFDGFAFGENFVWKLWDESTNTEYSAFPTYNTLDFPNEESYLTNGLSGIILLSAFEEITQYIDLPAGWSIFSTYINPVQSSFSDVFGNLSNLLIIKDEFGQIYSPQPYLNEIGNLTIGKAYQIYMNNNAIYSISGLAIIPENTPIILSQGWNLMAYLRQTPSPVEIVFSSIIANVMIVKNGNGEVFWQQFGINNIGDMQPGEGYQVKMNNSQVFTYIPN